VRGFAPELELSARIEVEVGPRRLQLANARWAPPSTRTSTAGGVAQRRTGRERIPAVERRRISRAERRRDPPCAYAVALSNSDRFREQEHVAMLRGAPRGVQASDAAADDEKAGAKPFGVLPWA
jgi:hypothetical protein